MHTKFSSKALEVNLASTRRQPIVIPEHHQYFLQFSASRPGLHKRAEEFMLEYHHPYSNRDYVIEHLRTIALKDLWFYSSLDDAEPVLLLITDIFEDLLCSHGLKERSNVRLIQTLCEFTAALAQKEPLSSGVFDSALRILETLLQDKANDVVCIRSSEYFKHYLKGLIYLEAFAPRVFAMIKSVLDKTFTFWETTSQVELWIEQRKTLFHDEYQKKIQRIGRPFFTTLQTQLNQAETWDDLLHLMFFQDIAEHFRQFPQEFETTLEKIYFIFYLLHLPGMDHLKDSLLWDLNRLLQSVWSTLNEEEILVFLENILALFREFKTHHQRTVLDCLFTLGKEIIATHDQRWLDAYVERLIDLGFVPPGTVYITKDWELEVDPSHLKNIRVWLELFEAAPSKLKQLLSALIVNLRLGGIFIADTDLFQRDITRLLNAEIAPLYKQIKQLTRIFPVYFHEIGAEGELRDITTAIDELSHREDRLIHFLRKSVHTESNNTHIDLAHDILHFWYDGNLDRLQEILPDNVIQAIDIRGKWFTSVHSILVELCRQQACAPEELFFLSEETFQTALSQVNVGDVVNHQRLNYLWQLTRLLREKYSLESTNIVKMLTKSQFFSDADITAFQNVLEAGQFHEALQRIYRFMEKLNQIILDPQQSDGWENIYYKRHIAAGIPSMYGQYHEPKFEALGLTFRLEKIASHLLSQMSQEINLDYITAKTLKRIGTVLDLFKEGLRLDGMENQGFNSNLKMFQYSLRSSSLSLAQYVNIFEFMASNVKEIINEYFLRVYEQPLRIIVPQLFDPDSRAGTEEIKQLIHKHSERFYREVLSSAFLIQMLDAFISEVLNSLHNTVDHFSPPLIRKMMSYDPDSIISPLYEETIAMDNPIFLGSKAYFLKKLYLLGFPIPPGFVFTTELFRHREAILQHPQMREEVFELMRRHLAQLERITGREFGTPENPLLLSVRSGSAISMPGAMTTFLNVGLNDEIVETFSRQPNFSWTSWDCYRRFLQCWGMAYGMDRDIFDQLMIEFKTRYHVEQKVQFSPEQMRTIAYAYKDVVHQHNISFEQEPFWQLRQAIAHVLDSWDSERARAYREHLQIADEWGTAVLVQKMILGNIQYQSSGTGVLFTHSPQSDTPGVHLYGDFTLCSQGEDIVGGLVHTLPLTEQQRQHTYAKTDQSLQSLLPSVHDRLWKISSQLIDTYGFSHQEIEFTFESERPEDVYILQTRDQNIRTQDTLCVFTANQNEMNQIGRGIGIGGGALNGILAFDLADLRFFQKMYPDRPRILVRPDTVPDDIEMIFECDGLLTSKGGATSHAAVTAVRLGKVCVVNCKDLHVNETEKVCELNGVRLTSGEKIAIDGHLGNIYQGNYQVEYTHLSSLG